MHVLRAIITLVQTACIAIILASPSWATEVDTGDEITELPLLLEPMRLCEALDAPEDTIHIAKARALHEEQAKLLGKLADEPDSWREMLIIGCMLALEEYYELELSYPQYTRQLTDSGCWMSEWADYDLEIGDFSPEYPSYPERMLVYLPQPLGLTKLKPTPGRGCAYYRRCFEEYSLAVSSSHADSWLEGNDPLHTYWMEPFLEFGIVELAHLDKENPGATKCATCS